MNRKKEMIFFFFFHLIIELILILISTINGKCLLICLVTYFLILIEEEKRGCEICFLVSLITVLFHYLFLTLSYAKILPWESGIVFLLFLLTFYYNIQFNLLNSQSPLKCLSIEKEKAREENISNVLMIKCQLSRICYYFYTFQLCLTTICTPSMYFNWFLIVENCQFTYSNFHSSYTLAGGMIVSLTWTIFSFYSLIKGRMK